MNYANATHNVLFVHDMGDLFLALGRSLADTRYKMATVICYILLVIFWFTYRLYLYPKLVYMSCFDNPAIDDMYGMYIIGTTAYFLLLMHCYWFYCILKIGYNMVVKREVTDSHHNKQD